VVVLLCRQPCAAQNTLKVGHPAILLVLFICVPDPDPNLDPDLPDLHVSGPPGSGSISQTCFVTSFGRFIFEK
jgi:hypothetical protein